MFASAFDLSKPGRTIIAGAPTGQDARVLAELALRSHGMPIIHVALEDALGFFAPPLPGASAPSVGLSAL